MKKLVVINLGSTSTKIACFEDDRCVRAEPLPHPAAEIQAFASNWDQYDYRKAAILDFMDRHGIRLEELDAFVNRGGHTQPIHSGVYRITEKMLEQSRSMKYGNHVSDLGVRLAYDLAPNKQTAFIVDSPCTDEYQLLARYSGLAELPRVSRFHVLNQKACARQYCADHGVEYADVNLMVVHMGGGTSVAAHRKGLLVDGNNGVVFVVLGMLIGVLLFYLIRRLSAHQFTAGQKAALTILNVVCSVLLIWYILYQPTWFELERWTVAFLCLVVIGLSLLNKDGLTALLNNRYTSGLLAYLGSISLYIYMLHYPAVIGTLRVLGHNTPETIYSFWEVYVPATVATVVLSAVVNEIMKRTIMKKK